MMKNTCSSFMVFLLFVLAGCSPKPPSLGKGFTDGFDRAELGQAYFDTIGRYRIINGRLNIEEAYNHPLWLRRRLTRDIEIAFDVESKSKDGDIKVELYGDGMSHAMNRGSYLATGYVICFGGWRNTKSFIARRNEHGKEGHDIVSRSDLKVQQGKQYRFRILRKGKEIKWYIDGVLFLTYEDPEPLYGSKNQYFGFNNWQSDVYFDNLVVRPLS